MLLAQVGFEKKQVESEPAPRTFRCAACTLQRFPKWRFISRT